MHLGFPLSKRGPRTLHEAHSMAVRIEQNILSEIRYLFTSGTLSIESLVALENFIVDFQEEGEKTIVINQQNEDMVEELEPEQNDEVSTCAPPSDEAILEPFPPAQQEDNKVSCFPFQDFDDTLFHDLGNEEEMDEPLGILNPSCYDTNSDIVDIDEFIHVGRRKWDIVGFDMDPIYDIENHFQVLPSQLSLQDTFDFDQWQQGDHVFTLTFQTPKDDPVPCFPDDFRSYLEVFDEYSSERLDPFHEDDYQPPLCSGFDKSKDLVCLKKDPCDNFPQPPPILVTTFPSHLRLLYFVVSLEV
jgi:hypothetical protein